MKRKLTVFALVIPLILAFLLLTPLLGAAVVGEHRFAAKHPRYLREFGCRMLGEGTGDASGVSPEALSRGDFLSQDISAVAQGSGRLNILLVGKDRVAGLTDVMILASFDKDAGSLQLLQIPRDTYAAYTDRSYKKLNGAYARLGGRGMVQFLSKNMAVPIDHYVCVDLSVLGEIVDAIGGVKINVPADMDYDDPSQNLHIHLKAGEQVLDGEGAQMFVRFRRGYALADIGRMDAQKLFLSALARQVKENLTPTQMVEMIGRSFGKVKTDMGLWDCVACAKLLRRVDLSAMHMMTLPGSSARTQGNSGAWYFILNREATAQVLSERMGSTGEFDPDGVFNQAARSSFNRIYHAPAAAFGGKDYTAQQALDGEVNIRRIS